MKMSPAAKTYLISGYPRSMRDVVEYSEKVIKSESVRPEGIQLSSKFIGIDSSY